MLKYVHHAYYLTVPISHPELIRILEKFYGVSMHGNQDFFDRQYDTFVIDDSRELKRLHSIRPIGDAVKKLFVIRANNITVEAQNALLKLIEEPAGYAYFFIVIPSAHILLPTMKSRMSEFGMDLVTKKSNNSLQSRDNSAIDAETVKTAHMLISMSKAKRIEEIKKIVGDISKEKKDIRDVISLLNALEEHIRSQFGVKAGADALGAIEFARTYVYDRAPSIKMLLEYVMLHL